MAIKYYPNRIFKKAVPSIDRVIAKRQPLIISGYHDIAASALDVTISPVNSDWQVNSISLAFSAATNKDYSVKVKGGRKVVTDLNDYLWFKVSGQLPQKITLSSGFYTGTELATQLQTQLNANSVFNAAGITHTVTYAAATGLFTVTNTSGQTVQYLNVNSAQTLRTQDSIAGHLFGLTTNSSAAVAITSDTAVFGLDSEAAIIDETASSHTERYHDDLHTLTIDQALHVEGTAAVANVMNYTIGYEEIV